MAQHNDFGQISEDRAAAYLMARGYTIRDRNWRVGHKEIDIIAQKDGVIAIVEVKARKSIDLPIRFDIISITGEPGHQKVEHIEEAFYPPLY